MRKAVEMLKKREREKERERERKKKDGLKSTIVFPCIVGSLHCSLLNLNCAWSNNMDFLEPRQCIGNRGMGYHEIL